MLVVATAVVAVAVATTLTASVIVLAVVVAVVALIAVGAVIAVVAVVAISSRYATLLPYMLTCTRIMYHRLYDTAVDALGASSCCFW